MAREKRKILLAEIPETLHAKLKSQAIKKGTSMRAITTKALEKELKLKRR
jgi:hypothetical protein